MLQTPLNPMFSGLDGREACAMDGELERFPSLDWSACASPPLTPGKHPSLFIFICGLIAACVRIWCCGCYADASGKQLGGRAFFGFSSRSWRGGRSWSLLFCIAA